MTDSLETRDPERHVRRQMLELVAVYEDNKLIAIGARDGGRLVTTDITEAIRALLEEHLP